MKKSKELKINTNNCSAIFFDEADEIKPKDAKKMWKALSKRKFVFYWWFTGWWDWALGISVSPDCPNVEIHLPFGFIRFGLERYYVSGDKVFCVPDNTRKRGYGIGG